MLGLALVLLVLVELAYFFECSALPFLDGYPRAKTWSEEVSESK